MRWIIGSSLKLRFMVISVVVALVGLGVTQLREAPVDVLPEFTPPTVEIQTESLGLSADEVEQLITVPMEQDLLNGLPWVDTIHSESVPGLSSVVITFKPGTDLMQARQMVAERMTQAVALPHVSKPPTILQPVSATGRVMIVGLSSRSLSMIQMGVLARWTIAPRLLGVPGVASVAVWGQRDRQLQVLVDPKRLKSLDVPLQDVLATTGNALWVSTLSFVEASTPGTGGFVDTPNQRLGVRHVSPIITPEGLAQVPISDMKKADGTPLQLGDVANVIEDHQPLIGDAMVNSGPGLLLVVQKLPGANTLDVTRSVEEVLSQMEPGLPDVTVNTSIYRPATFIEQSMVNVGRALLAGFAILLLVLGILFWDWRITLVSALTIPISLVAAALVLYLREATLNAMVLAGFLVATGAVVDDAIVGVGNIGRRLRQQVDGNTTSKAETIVEAVLEMRGPIAFATTIVVVAVLPVFFIAGLAGPFFRPLAISYVLALLASTAVALVVAPALSMVVLSDRPSTPRQSPVVRWIARGYDRVISRTVREARPTYLIGAVLLLACVATTPFLKQSLVPTFREPQVAVRLDAVPGTSQPEMSRIAGRISAEMQSIPGIHDVGAHIGRAVFGDQVVGVNSAEIWVNIDPSADYEKTLASIQHVASAYPGIRAQVQGYVNGASQKVLTPSREAVTVRVYGDTEEALRDSAENVQKAITGVGGISSSHVVLPVEQLTVETEVDIAAAQRYGLKPGDVRRTAAVLLSGIQVGSLFEESKIFDVVVWSTPETRHSLSSIRDLSIDTPDGGHVRLGDIAQVRIVPTPAVIRHDAVKRYMDVVADVQGRELGAVAAEIKTRLQQVKFPLEYHAEVLGDYAAPRADLLRLVSAVAAAVLVSLFLLQAAVGNWRLAAVCMLILPGALAGGLLAALATGGTISIGSLVGILALFGIAVRNCIQLINRYQHLERQEGEAFGPELALRGARECLSRVITTAFAAGLGLVPMLVMGDVPGLELARPMAIVFLGGLATSTLLSLFVMPALYLGLGIHAPARLHLLPAVSVSYAEVLGEPVGSSDQTAGEAAA